MEWPVADDDGARQRAAHAECADAGAWQIARLAACHRGSVFAILSPEGSAAKEESRREINHGRAIFPLNAWYVVAWSHEVGKRSILARTICNKRVALWRRADNSLAAVEDACWHRLAPLSLGWIRE